VGLELREPFLDHQLTAWCLQLPVARRYNHRTKTSKLLPRRLLARRVPREMFERPKQGFTPPLRAWLSGPLKGVADDALAALRRGDLAPLRWPAGFTDWDAYTASVNDVHDQLLWRVICYAGWKKHLAGSPTA
jgi:asparagine synthase (glutamine-hydrolysing)